MKKGVCVRLFIVVLFFCSDLVATEVYKAHTLGYLAHYAKYSDTSLKKYRAEYNGLAVTGYSVLDDGSVKIVNPAFHKRCMEIYGPSFLPVLTLSSAKNGITILKSEDLRRKCAADIIAFLDDIESGKVQFDFEYIPSQYNDEYALLLKELKVRRPSLFVSVCIAPQIDSIPEYAGFFDVRALDNYADEFMLMSYDYYGPLRKNGPVTDVEWTEKNLKHLLQFTEPSKLILGAPLYGYWWDSSGKERVFTERAFYRKFDEKQTVRMKEGTVTIAHLETSPYHFLSVGDRHTVELFTQIAQKYRLKGVGIWRLGFEK